MAQSERQKLELHILIITRWTIEKNPGELFDTFIHLDRLDTAKNKDLWEALREALAANEALKDKAARKYISHPKFVRKDKSNWWWNAKNWKARK